MRGRPPSAPSDKLLRLTQSRRHRVGLPVHLDHHVVVERSPGDAAVGVTDPEERVDELRRKPKVEQVLAVAQPPHLRSGARDHRTVDVVAGRIELPRCLFGELVPARGRHDDLEPSRTRRPHRGDVSLAHVLVSPEQRAIEIERQPPDAHARQSVATPRY